MTGWSASTCWNTTWAGRFEFHDLLGAYAAEQATLTEPAAERAAAVDRILGWYLHSAHRGHRVLHPAGRADLVGPPPMGFEPVAFGDYQKALAWFEAEHDALVAGVRFADRAGRHETAWQLALALLSYLRIYRSRVECVEIATIALRSAQRAGSVRGQYHAANGLAMDHDAAGRPNRAIELLEQALESCERSGTTPT